MDESIRIEWYDLDPSDVSDHHEWLHHTYIPEVRCSARNRLGRAL